MKICEIVEQNQIWLILQGKSIDVDKDFKKCSELLELLIRLHDPSRNRYWAAAINHHESNIQSVIDIDFPISDDPDIVSVKSKAIRMIDEIAKLKSQLRVK